MKKIIFTATLIFVTSFVVFAQSTEETNKESDRIFVVHSSAFRDSANCIKELPTAYERIDNEVRPLKNELDDLSAKIRELNKNIPVLPCERWRFQNEIYDLQKMQRDYDKKTDRIKSIYEKREAELANPVIKKISVALAKFKEQKGYSIILYISGNKSDFLTNDDSDVTAEFIQFYNSIYCKTIP